MIALLSSSKDQWKVIRLERPNEWPKAIQDCIEGLQSTLRERRQEMFKEVSEIKHQGEGYGFDCSFDGKAYETEGVLLRVPGKMRA